MEVDKGQGQDRKGEERGRAKDSNDDDADAQQRGDGGGTRSNDARFNYTEVEEVERPPLMVDGRRQALGEIRNARRNREEELEPVSARLTPSTIGR